MSADPKPTTPTTTKAAFQEAGQQQNASIVGEFIEFLKHNKKWWLFPIIIVLLGVGGLLLFAGSAAAPFIYAIF